MAVAQHSIPPSVEAAQSEGTVQLTTSLAGHVPSHLGAVVEIFAAQHVSPLGHGVPGQAPESTGAPLLLPLELPLLLPLEPPLLLPLELPPLLPLEPPLLPLELPLPDEVPPLELPPPSGLVSGVEELVPQAIQTSALAATAAIPNDRDADARDAMELLRARAAP